ncbi:MAG: TonB-dependent receptor, partial [Oxalobacteraceae bacterium]
MLLSPERSKHFSRHHITLSRTNGFETAFLDSRIGLDATVYQTNTSNQILPVSVSAATGYLTRYVNGGEVRNRGIELAAYVVPVKTEDFNWRVSANWTHNDNVVVSQALDNIVVATYQGGVSSNSTVGQAFGVLRGTNFVYNNGEKQVLASGYYDRTDANQVISN